MYTDVVKRQSINTTEMCTKHTKGKHLTQVDRFKIEAFRDDGLNGYAISRILDILPSTIYRELKKVRYIGESYCASNAQSISNERRRNSKIKHRKIDNNPMLAIKIEKSLCGLNTSVGDYSPEVIANSVCLGEVSHPTIYSWIRRKRRDLIKHLPHQGHKYKKHGSNPIYSTIIATNPKLIDERPDEADDRSQMGHFEGDTVRGGKVRSITLVDRKSRFLISKINRHIGIGLAVSIADMTVEELKKLPESHRHTITFDQGSEFAWWNDMEKRVDNLSIYFAHAHHPWERGTDERTNGLIRRYFPKSVDFDTITDEEYASVVWMINHRPRKILHWHTACEVFGACCNSDFN